ncbi:MAG: hypothetical protein ABGW66_05565 [Flavobacteriaceae bacterium]
MVKKATIDVGSVVCGCVDKNTRSKRTNDFSGCRCTIWKSGKITKKFVSRLISLQV